MNYLVVEKKLKLMCMFICLLGLNACANTTSNQSVLKAKLNQEAIKSDLDAHIEEYKAIKPAIDRLVAVEQDLRTLMQQLALIEPLPKPDSNEKEVVLAKELKETNKISSADELTNEPLNNELSKEESRDALLVNNDIAMNTIHSQVDKSEESTNNESRKQNQDISQEELQTQFIEDSFVQVSMPSSKATTESISSDVSAVPKPPVVNKSRLFPTELYEKCIPKEVNSNKDLYGVHVSSFKVSNKLPVGWNNLVKKFPEVCTKGAVVQYVTINDTPFYSLRVGPFETKNMAKALCADMKIKSQYCRVTDFAGEML